MKSTKIFKGLRIVLGLILLLVGVLSMVNTGGMDLFSSGVSTAGLAMTAITWEDGTDNIGGFTCEAFIGFRSDIASYPTLKAIPTGYIDLVKLIGDYTMKSTRKFIEVYVTPETFKGDAETQGEKDGQSFKSKGELFYPGTKAECLGFCKAINNQKGVLIGIDPNDGVRYNWGQKGLPVTFKVKIAFGQKAADRRGATISWESDNSAPAFIYGGIIPLDPASIPAIS